MEDFTVGTKFEMDAGPNFVNMQTGKIEPTSWRECEIVRRSHDGKGVNYTFSGMGRYYDPVTTLQERIGRGSIRNIRRP